MRPNYHTSGKSWAVNLSDALPVQAPVQESALDLPGEQKFGLVSLLKSGPDSAAGQICARLDEQGVPYPKLHPHWYDLRRLGYVTHIGGRHALTPKGKGAAQAIIKDLCFKFSIHVFNHEGGRGTRGGTWTRCSCGTFSSGPHNNDRFGTSRIRTAQDGHIREVTSGVWPRRMVDFLNEVAPLKFDFISSPAAGTSQSLAADHPGTVASCVSVIVPGDSLEVPR